MNHTWPGLTPSGPATANVLKRTGGQSRPFRAPLSGQVLGFAARRFGLEVSRSTRNAARYFNGGQVSDRARKKIISSLALDLVEQGLFPQLSVPNYDGVSSPRSSTD